MPINATTTDESGQLDLGRKPADLSRPIESVAITPSVLGAGLSPNVRKRYTTISENIGRSRRAECEPLGVTMQDAIEHAVGPARMAVKWPCSSPN